MKQKEVRPVLDALEEGFGMTGIDPEAPLEVAEVERRTIYLLDNEVIAMDVEGKIAPALRGLLRWKASKRWVTVDMGAIRFVTNGADIMAPGITDADPDIAEGDPVWVRDETHGRPLAIGQARLSGAELKSGDKGKVVANLHTVGDGYWSIGHEE